MFWILALFLLKKYKWSITADNRSLPQGKAERACTGGLKIERELCHISVAMQNRCREVCRSSFFFLSDKKGRKLGYSSISALAQRCPVSFSGESPGSRYQWTAKGGSVPFWWSRSAAVFLPAQFFGGMLLASIEYLQSAAGFQHFPWRSSRSNHRHSIWLVFEVRTQGLVLCSSASTFFWLWSSSDF